MKLINSSRAKGCTFGFNSDSQRVCTHEFTISSSITCPTGELARPGQLAARCARCPRLLTFNACLGARLFHMADVEVMFHQVRVTRTDTDALRFLWWEDGDFQKPMKDYQMLVHLFEATSSPSCDGFALHKTVEDNQEDFDMTYLTYLT